MTRDWLAAVEPLFAPMAAPEGHLAGATPPADPIPPGELAGYVGTMTARIAALVEPTVVTLGVLYVMVWGWLQLTGRIDEPVQQGLKRIATLAIVFGVALHLWLYNGVIVDTVANGPGQLAAGAIGAFDAVTIVDDILFGETAKPIRRLE